MAQRTVLSRSGKIALLFPAVAAASMAMADSNGLTATVNINGLQSGLIAAAGLDTSDYFVNTGPSEDPIQVLTGGSSTTAAAKGPASGPAATAVPTLSGGSGSSSAAAIAQATTIGVLGDGKPDFVYNPSTGDVLFTLDGKATLTTGGQPSFITSLTIQSNPGKILFNNVRALFNTGSGVTRSATLLASALTATPGFTDGTTNGDNQTGAAGQTWDMGNIFPTGMADTDITGVFTVKYQILNGGALTAGDVVFAPEPASLGLIGMTAAGLLARRRAKRAQSTM